VQNIGGQKVAAIAVTISGPAEGKGTMYLTMSDGQLLRTKLAISVKSGAAGAVKVAMSIKRL
jgi:hypothetical protein